MGFEARVIADSVTGDNHRLTTLLVTYPRIIHSEMLRHREFSRNAASSRAIPVRISLDQVRNEPFIPIYWGAAAAGMQANGEVSEAAKETAKRVWLAARDSAVEYVSHLLELRLHKQIPNRLLEPFLWITEVVSSTRWNNFFHLRCHEAAEPHIQKVAAMMREQLKLSTPVRREPGQWHLPFIDDDERTTLGERVARAVSAVRCARVSYNRHNDKRDLKEDLARFDDLTDMGHWSPLEHVAQALPEVTFGPHEPSNFTGPWRQLRKEYVDYVK
jgi:thymidylate synthase ThyX